jgi:hypothetical protein
MEMKGILSFTTSNLQLGWFSFCVSSLTILVPKNPCTETNEKEYSHLQMARFLDFTECRTFKPLPTR